MVLSFVAVDLADARRAPWRATRRAVFARFDGVVSGSRVLRIQGSSEPVTGGAAHPLTVFLPAGGSERSRRRPHPAAEQDRRGALRDDDRLDPAERSICVGAVLGGSVFGDPCSPISDSTILSSLSTDCDLMDRVPTWSPPALPAAGAVASTVSAAPL